MFEENLDRDTSDGPDLSGMTIKFVLAVDSRESASMAEFQATDIIAPTTEGISAFGPTPRAVGFTTSAVDTTTNVVTKVQTLANTWAVLLERMELLSKIVVDIAEVFGTPRLDPLLLNDR